MPATVVPNRISIASNDDIVSPMYASLELVRRFTDLQRESDKILRLEQRLDKKDYKWPVRFAQIFILGDYVLLDRPTLFRSAAERSAVEGYSKLLPRNQGPYKVVAVSEKKLQIVQD